MQESLVWKLSKYSMVLFFVILAFALPGLVFGTSVPDDYKIKTLLGTWTATITLSSIIWYLVKQKFRSAAILFWILITFISLFSWYWNSTFEDRILENYINAENALKDYEYIIHDDWTSEKKVWYLEKFKNDFNIQNALITKYKLDKEYKQMEFQYNINYSIVGFVIGIAMTLITLTPKRDISTRNSGKTL